MEKQEGIVETPMGSVILEVRDGFLLEVRMVREKLKSLRIPPFTDQIEEYFAGKRKRFTLPFLFRGTPFQKRVWKALAQVPFGTVLFYRDLAVLAFGKGQERFSRAVGGAVGKNPLPIVIPCHRVVASSGALGGFSSGLEWKRFLLTLEGIPLDRTSLLSKKIVE